MRRSTLIRGAVVAAGALLAAAAAGLAPWIWGVTIAAVVALVLAGETLVATGAPSPRPAPQREAVVDTSALIDGRFADVAASGFLDRDLVVPGIVLAELQHLADAPDAARRARGRRGLDVLADLRTSARVRVIDGDAGSGDVDRRLVEIALARGAALLTTDFNLAKVAGIRGVPVLNVNDLAHALRPVVLPGESLRVTVVKEGREPGQGVAYLEDGTMVVVEQARARLGQTIEVVVTSAIQTAAGKMFFAKPAE
jgi:uncharacterized protein YacL